MDTIKILINRALPKTSKEEIKICLFKLVLESNEESKKKADKETWMFLMEKVFDSGLMAEFCDFYLENTELSMLELHNQFCNEWDLLFLFKLLIIYPNS